MIESVGLYNTCTCSFGALEGHKVQARQASNSKQACVCVCV